MNTNMTMNNTTASSSSSSSSSIKPTSFNVKISLLLGIVILAAPCANNQAHAFITRQPAELATATATNTQLFATMFEPEKPSASRFAFLQNARQAISSNAPQHAMDPATPANPFWSTTANTNTDAAPSLPPKSTSRRAWMHSMVALAVATTYTTEQKQLNLPDEQLAQIIISDIVNKKSLVTADVTRSIYDEQATFKDGSDLDGKYYREQWVRGCRMLFDADECESRLIEDTLSVTKHKVTFRFEEDLTFRGPFSPKCFLSGTVVMKRCPMSGLIKSR